MQVVTARARHRARPSDRLGAETWLLRALVALPDRVLLISLAAVFAVALSVQARIFHPWVVAPLFVAIAALLWKLAPARLESATRGGRRALWIGSAIAGLIAIGWVVVNLHFYAEYTSLTRDPAIYTNRAFWIWHTGAPDGTVPADVLHVVRAVPGLKPTVWSKGDHLYFQSTSMLPGLMAIGGWVHGGVGILQAPVVIGGVALMSIYAVGRRLAGPLLALVPVIALATSMAFAGLTRVPYTEPISLVLAMTGVLGLWTAWTERRRGLWVLAGLGCGAVQIARVDGALVAVGALIGIGVMGGLASSAETRRRVLACLGWFCAGLLPGLALGVTDMLLYSPAYFRDLMPNAAILLLAVPACAVLAALVTVLPLRVPSAWLRAHRRGAGTVAGGLAAAIAVAMVLRPLYLTMHQISGAGYQAAVAALQKAQGLPIDPSRSYDELSITWLSWYFGWPAVIGAGLCAVAAVVVVVRRRSVPLLLFGTLIGTSALLYLNLVQITPDQIWAMRRFLPVIIPGMLLVLAWGLGELVRWAPGRSLLRWPRPAGQRARPPRALVVAHRGVAPAVVAFAAIVVLWPAFTWGPMFTSVEGRGRLAFTEQICDRLPQGGQVVILGPSWGSQQPPIQSICQRKAVALATVSTGSLAAIVKDWPPGPVTAVAFNVKAVPWTTAPSAPVATDQFEMWQRSLTGPPDASTAMSESVWMGTVNPDGTVTPLGG